MEERHIGREVRKLSNVIKRAADTMDIMKETKRLTGMHGWVIGFLYENRGREIFQRDVETEFEIRRSTATEILKLMENNGLITKEFVPYDARLKKLALTPKAVAMHEQLIRELEALDKNLRRGIDDAELKAFYGTIEKIINNIQ